MLDVRTVAFVSTLPMTSRGIIQAELIYEHDLLREMEKRLSRILTALEVTKFGLPSTVLETNGEESQAHPVASFCKLDSAPLKISESPP